MATINLATKYSPKVVDKFYLDSVVLGKTSKEYDWDGVEIQLLAPFCSNTIEKFAKLLGHPNVNMVYTNKDNQQPSYVCLFST